MDKDYSELIQYLDERFSKVETRLDKIDERINQLVTAIDKLAKNGFINLLKNLV